MGSSAEHVDAGVPESKRQNNSSERRRSTVIRASRARDRHVPVSGCQGRSGHGGNVKPAATLEKLMSRLLGMCLLTLPLMIVPVLAQDSARWHDPSKHRVRFVTVEDGVQLEVLDWGGTGRPIVLLAGLGFTAHVFDGFAEKLTDSYHVYGITRRGYGASSLPKSGYGEQRRAEDDLRVFDALKLVAPVVVGHSVAGDELSQLGIFHPERIGALVYLDALNDGTDDYTEYDALCNKLPEPMGKPPTPSPSGLESFSGYRDWRGRTEGIRIPEAEFRNNFAENPDGSVGSRKAPSYVPEGIMGGDRKHDYSRICVPVLAFVGYPA